MTKFRVVNTDNFGGDYPDEKFIGPEYDSKEEAQKAADELNGPYEHAILNARYNKVVTLPYTLAPGFEP